MSHAQDSVIPETTRASGASTSLHSSSVVDLPENVIEHEIATYCIKKVVADKVYALAKGAVEKGACNWERTSTTFSNPLTSIFKLVLKV